MLCERCHSQIEPELPPIDEAVFDRETHTVIVDGEARWTEPFLWRMLEFFWARQGQLLSKERIYDYLWGDSLDPPQDKCRVVHTYRLRRVLQGSPYSITTVGQAGYRFERIDG